MGRLLLLAAAVHAYTNKNRTHASFFPPCLDSVIIILSAYVCRKGEWFILMRSHMYSQASYDTVVGDINVPLFFSCSYIHPTRKEMIKARILDCFLLKHTLNKKYKTKKPNHWT